MTLSIKATVLLDGPPFFPQCVSDRVIPTLILGRVRTYSRYGVVPLCVHLSSLWLCIISMILFTSTYLTGLPPYISCKQHPVGWTATTYMLLSRCGQWLYFWRDLGTTMASFGDLRSQLRGQVGMLDPLFFLLTKDTVLHGRCQLRFFCMVISNYGMNYYQCFVWVVGSSWVFGMSNMSFLLYGLVLKHHSFFAFVTSFMNST